MAKKKNGFRRCKGCEKGEKCKTPNRSKKRKEWSEQQMTAAMDAVMKKGLTGNRAADIHGVPRSTLKDRLSGRVIHGVNPGPKSYLTKSEESELANHLLTASSIGYGKTRRDVRCLVESYLKQQRTLRGEKISNGWWEKFLKRNPTLSLRSGDSTAGVRMEAINKENLDNYFDLLRSVYDDFDFDKFPECIYNMDETGVPLCPHPPKVIAKRGQKKVRYRTSGQKSQITVIGCGSATGQVIPPFIIYAAKQISPLWTNDEVNGSRFAVSDNGWVDQELFYFWLKEHFICNAVSRRPLLLLLDGHSSHFEPSTIQFAKANDIIVFCIPPHTTHECQPLDCSFFRSLKTHWQESCHSFYQKNPGKVITKINFCSVFKPAWNNAANPSNIIGGFKKTGVFPFNRLAISTPETSDHEHQYLDKTSSNANVADICSEPDTEQQHISSTSDVADSYCDGQFSMEEELLFARRLEEGYDLSDPRYDDWLKVKATREQKEVQLSPAQYVQPLVSTLPSPYSATTPPCPHSVTTPPCPHSVTTPPSPPSVTTPPFSPSVTTPPFSPSVTTPPSPPSVTTPPFPPSVTTPPSPPSVTTPPSPPSVTTPPSLRSVTTPPSQHLVTTPSSQHSVTAPPSHHLVTTSPYQHSETTPSSLPSVTTLLSLPSVTTPSSLPSESTPPSEPSVPTCPSMPSVITPPPVPSVAAPTHSTSNSPSSARLSGINSSQTGIVNTTPIRPHVIKKRSPFSELLNLPTCKGPKHKTGHARVLTSAECLSIMKEKEESKKRDLEEKERRKQERLLKKKQKEEEQKQKEAERIRKAAEREERRKHMEAEKIRKATERKTLKAKRGRQAKQPQVPSTSDESNGTLKAKRGRQAKQPQVPSTSDESNGAESGLGSKPSNSSLRPLRKKRKLNVDNLIFSDLCCVCFGSYDEDKGTGREWLECECGRWIHQDCVVPNCSSSNKLCPLC